MFCFKCGSEVAEGHDFCGKCGTAVSGLVRTLSEDVYEKKPEGMPLGRMVVLVVLGLAVLLLVVNIFGGESTRNPSSASRYAAPLIRHEIQKLISGSHTVEPRQMSSLKFTILPEMRNARVHGRFEAEGGSGNDIQAFLTDEDGYLNAKNGHQYRAYYSSGKVTADTMDVRLAPGTYYLVFSNAFSLISNKAYNADVVLEYDRSL